MPLTTIFAALERIEHKLDALIAALAAEDDAEDGAPRATLDGQAVGGERDQEIEL